MLPAWLALLLALSATLVAWNLSGKSVEKSLRQEFELHSKELEYRLLNRFEGHNQLLRGAAALFSGSAHVSREEWHNYVATLRLEQHYPAIQALAFARRVTPNELHSLTREIRASGVPDFALSPLGQRDAYVLNVFAEPFVGLNQKALGYDMWQDPLRRLAMENAVQRNEPTVTGKVVLKIDEPSKPIPAVIVFLPVRKSASAAVFGFVLSPIRLPTLLSDIQSTATQGIKLAIYDGHVASAENLMFKEEFTALHPTPRFTHQQTIEVAGRHWTLVFASDDGFIAARPIHRQPLLVLAAGFLLSLLLFALIRSEILTRQRAEALAQDMTTHLRASEVRFRELFHQAPLGIWLLDHESKVIDCNDIFAEYAGAPMEKIIGFNILRDARDRAFIPALQEALEGRESVIETRYTSTTGDHSAIYRYHFTPIHIEGLPDLILSFAEDITERRGAEERHGRIIQASMDGFLLVDRNGQIKQCNEALCQLTGYPATEITQLSIADLEANENDAEVTQHITEVIEKGGDRFESRWRRKDGSLVEIEVTATYLEITQELCGFVRDITLGKEHERELDRIAHYDTLTGVPNRTLLADRMKQAVARTLRDNTLMAICYLDLDGFKPINDRFGHQAGDQLLIEIADRLKACLRGSDTVARMGGDEFVLLLLGILGSEECEAALMRILDEVARPVLVGEHEVTVSASIGVALFPRDDADMDTLLRHADQSMYLAKQSGKNRFHIFDPDRDRIARDRVEKLVRIADGIVNNEFVLYYQPQVDMRAGRVNGAEVLIRWLHPELGLLPPAEFLSVIEDSDLIVDLGNMIIDAALQQISVWQASGLDIRLSVNIAARHLLRTDFVARLEQHLEAHPDVSPMKLELEVVETAALDDIKRVSQTIHGCLALGVGFALDDFGTGYSSLTYLKALPAQLLKIDQTFVRDMLTDKEDCAIVEGVIGLARVFHRQVIAEGVETIEHGRMLIKLGCDLAQGYGIARPMSAASLSEWITQWRPDPSWQSIETFGRVP